MGWCAGLAGVGLQGRRGGQVEAQRGGCLLRGGLVPPARDLFVGGQGAHFGFVQVEDAVEVVGFVGDDARGPAGDVFGDGGALVVVCGEGDGARAGHDGLVAGDGEAPFVEGDELVGGGLVGGVDECGEWQGCALAGCRMFGRGGARVFAHSQPEADPDLRGGESHAGGCEHGGAHGGEQFQQGGVVDLAVEARGGGAQNGVTCGDDGDDAVVVRGLGQGPVDLLTDGLRRDLVALVSVVGAWLRRGSVHGSNSTCFALPTPVRMSPVSTLGVAN